MATLVFQQSLDDSKNNNDPERTCGGTHTHAEDDTHLTRHILLLFGGGGGVLSSLFCSAVFVRLCVALRTHERDGV